jgi:LysM repeat protein
VLAGPAACLAAVTLVIGGVRVFRPHSSSPTPSAVAHRERAAAAGAAHRRPAHLYYTVRAGDTLAAVAVRTHVPLTRIRGLNPKLEPTALFIGQRIRLR